jgi:hypothetical protein
VESLVVRHMTKSASVRNTECSLWKSADGRLPLEIISWCTDGEKTAVRERAKPASALSLLHECVVFYVKVTMPLLPHLSFLTTMEGHYPASWRKRATGSRPSTSAA